VQPELIDTNNCISLSNIQYLYIRFNT